MPKATSSLYQDAATGRGASNDESGRQKTFWERLGARKQSGEPPIAPVCFYTIRDEDVLERFLKTGTGSFVEKKAWVYAAEKLEEAKSAGMRVPLFLERAGDIREITYGAWLTRVEISGSGTSRTTLIGFESLTKFAPPYPKQSLVVRSTGSPLSEAFIRNYVICHTPDFLTKTLPCPIGALQGGLSELERRAEATVLAEDKFRVVSEDDARQKTMQAIVQRRGQSRFRRALLAAYGGRCAISGCDVVEVLEAAHIVPFNGEQTDHIANGLLLRTDLHTLFDLGLVAVDPEASCVVVSASLRGTIYEEFNGRPLRLPGDPACQPSKTALTWRWNNQTG